MTSAWPVSEDIHNATAAAARGQTTAAFNHRKGGIEVTRSIIIMACVAAAAALAGLIIITRPTRNEQDVYIKRIAGAMFFAGAIMLALFTYGLEMIGN